PGGKERQIATPIVVEYIEFQKLSKPSITAFEIQVALMNDGVCNLENLPSKSTMSDVLRKDLNFTFKKLKVVPQESLNEQNRVKSIEYAMLMSQVDPSRVHFDESSVKRTTGNRHYGHAKRGKRAVEVKRYTSNCNYTINLLQSRFGITHYNLLGASNGLEMLYFFHESMQVVGEFYGNPVLAHGNIVVIDNCLFHHRHFAEAELQRMLGQTSIFSRI
ncbi:Paired box Pax-2a, partial [Paramuricea clavata]